MNNVFGLLLNKLQNKNLKGFQTIQQMMNSGQQPDGMIKQLMDNMNDAQKQNLFKQAKTFGVPDSVLSQVQNMK